MNREQRLKLNEIMEQNNTIDNTQEIKRLKHSKKIRDDIYKLVKIKKENNNIYDIKSKGQNECVFLFKNYTNIYNKLIQNDLDLNIMFSFLDILEKVEKGQCDQQEASYEIGVLLKQLYIDTKINTQENKRQTKNITWNEYKSLKLN